MVTKAKIANVSKLLAMLKTYYGESMGQALTRIYIQMVYGEQFQCSYNLTSTWARHESQFSAKSELHKIILKLHSHKLFGTMIFFVSFFVSVLVSIVF